MGAVALLPYTLKMQDVAISRAGTLPTRAFIAQQLASQPPLDQLLTADDLERQQLAAGQELKPAAVLLLVVDRAEPAVVFTQRTAHLADHAGQISFPGGRCEAADR